ncbi:MAG: sulfurtransferase TusA family protein [Acidobacteriota bacterium]|jgi:TusA-related sulfurtransferase|nr:sulfurtransferase TusA family protein [Acidobacteriota bacterium]
MSDVKTVDARGLSCPQPVLLAQAAIKNMEKGAVRVLVDSETARDNVTRIAQKAGWSAEAQEQPGGVIQITLTR